MQIYLVGGAVRDRLLGEPIVERDWVVVGTRAQQLEALGYQRVGKTFPVFLHPETQEEYALARTETKTGPGYRGFEVRADPAVTLEEDLQRRDLTINAMAETPDGEVIDPWGGRADLENKQLRHVSAAFREDPVRILRVARFAARFACLDFTVAKETTAIMQAMVATGEADSLVPERVWRETERALQTANPEKFFEVLRDCGALAIVYPEIDALFQQSSATTAPRKNRGELRLEQLQRATGVSTETEVRFAVLVHDLRDHVPAADQQAARDDPDPVQLDRVRSLCTRIGAPKRYLDIALLVSRFHDPVHHAEKLSPAELLEILESVDALRRPDRLASFLKACAAIPPATDANAQGLFTRAQQAAASVDVARLQEQGFAGKALGQALRNARIKAIEASD